MRPEPQPLPATSPDDETVIRRVREGETALFEVLMRRYNQRLYRVVRGVLGSDADVEDVLQEAYLKAYSHLHQFEGRSSFATWLTKIALHEALARARKGRRLQPLEEEADGQPRVLQFPSKLPDPEQDAARHELMGLIEEAVDQLPGSFREVFVLREIEQLSQAETAACLEIREETVKTRLHRARGRIESYLLSRAGQEIRRAYEFGDSRCSRVVSLVLQRISAP